MNPVPIASCLAHIRRVALVNGESGPSDGQLLGEFVGQRDETAFAALVKRHASMVFGVCQRLVGDVHLAEDAFQAVFIVLARRAASVRPREQIGNWLYGVAYRTALKARAMLARRRSREKQVIVMPHPQVLPDEIWHDVQGVLDAELAQLPDKLRLPVVLCDLQGRPQREVARQLKLPPATLANRLASARRRLAERLAKRGIALSGGALAATITDHCARAAAPAGLISQATEAGRAISAGATFIESASAQAIQLSEGVIQMLFVAKLRKCALSVAIVLVLTCGFGAAALSNAWADDSTPTSKNALTPMPSSSTKPSNSKLDDKEFLRRVCLDLRGDAPTEIETIYFVADGDAHKRSKVVEWLLEDPQAHAWREARKNPWKKAAVNQCAACHQDVFAHIVTDAPTDTSHHGWFTTAKTYLLSDGKPDVFRGHLHMADVPDQAWIEGFHDPAVLAYWLDSPRDSSDEAFLRRASQEARGTPPTHLEIEYFKADKDAKKRERLLDLLVKDPAVAKKLGDGWKQKMLQADDSTLEKTKIRDYHAVTKSKVYELYQYRGAAGPVVPERLVQLLGKLLKEKRNDEQILEALALATLGRLPTESEKKLIVAGIAKQEDKAAAWRDVLKMFAGTNEARQYAEELGSGGPKAPKK
jgi:RNA polymerase sigma factor (sigma-70 family)